MALLQQSRTAENVVAGFKRPKQNFDFGKYVDNGSPATINLPKLIKTRMVIEASSGGGKSYLMRKLMELFFGYVQQIVIDPEGEFASLREQFGFVLATADRNNETGELLGDIEADSKTADVLAHTILRTRASIIVDISELSIDDRRLYVKNFVQALVESPRELWHPVIIWLDEGHEFAPETGKGKSESLPAIKDLASKGRKRGQTLVVATQRLSKLSKDVVAECKNYMIGETNLLDDQERAGEILGFTSGKEGKALKQELRTLNYVFWASGSVFNTALRQVKAGQVITHPPEIESGSQYVPPPTPEEVKPLLEAFKEIPIVKKRNLDERTELLAKVRDLQSTNQSLMMKNRHLESQTQNTVLSTEKMKVIQDEWFTRGQRAIIEKFNQSFKQTQQSLAKSRDVIQELSKYAGSVKQKADQFLETVVPDMPAMIPLPEIKTAPLGIRSMLPPTPIGGKPRPTIAAIFEGQQQLDEQSSVLGKCERAGLKFLALREGKEFTKQQVGAMTQYSPTSGGFSNSLSRLKTAGLIKYSNALVCLISERLPDVIQILGDEYNAPEQNALEGWLGKLGLAAKTIYKVLLDNPHTEFTKEELAEQTKYSATSGGFSNAISNICTLGLAERIDGKIRFNQELLGV